MTPSPTPLQEASACARACLADAREKLSAEAWPHFIELLIELAAHGAKNLVLADAVRRAREGDP